MSKSTVRGSERQAERRLPDHDYEDELLDRVEPDTSQLAERGD